MFRIILAAIVGGAMLMYFGFNQFRLASKVELEPSEHTLQQLADGDYENAYVTVSDFLVTGDFVYEAKSNSGPYETIWAPLVSFDDPMFAGIEQAIVDGDTDEMQRLLRQGPDGSNIRVVLKSQNLKNDAAFDAFAERESFTGVVVNDIESLSSDTVKLLEEAYPGLDGGTVLIVEEGREPPSTGGALAMMLGGLGLTGGGAAGGVAAKRRG